MDDDDENQNDHLLGINFVQKKEFGMSKIEYMVLRSETKCGR